MEKLIWGFYHNSSFWGGLRTGDGTWYAVAKVEGPNITRYDPEKQGPLFTENLDSLSSSLKQYGFPGLIHHYGLWYDRRRDAHDLGMRQDSNVIAPFLEMPWARSNTGKAADGLSKYDLTRFNPWYFERLVQFARLCDEKGLVFYFDFYQQHMLIESKAHYEDFPWRPCNNIQNLSLPNTTPAANAFYEVSTLLQQDLHRLYIKKCLDELGHFRNVVFCLSQEYTGPQSFVKFWLKIVQEWEQENQQQLNIAIGATKDVTEAILANPEYASMIGTIDMSRWWYDRDGTIFAPPGGMEVPGRYMGRSSNTSPGQIYRLISEYRRMYPSKAILHSFSASHQQLWAFLIAGGSMLMTDFNYPDSPPPAEPFAPPSHYIPPEKWPLIEPTYKFINTFLGESLLRMTPNRYVISNPEDGWALSDGNTEYLIYLLHGGPVTLGLPKIKGPLVARWFNPGNGMIYEIQDSVITGKRVILSPPDDGSSGKDWVLWLAGRNSGIVQKNNHPEIVANLEIRPVYSSSNESNEIITEDRQSEETSPECFHHEYGAMLKINFQPTGIVPPDGYSEDNGLLYGKHSGYRYGWLTDHSDRMLHRLQLPPARRQSDIRLETICDVKSDAVWELEVENGYYLVEITAGDPVYPSYCTVKVEGVLFWDAKSLYTNEFVTLERRVSVRDGKLTISAQGGEQHSTKLSSVTIIAVADP